MSRSSAIHARWKAVAAGLFAAALGAAACGDDVVPTGPGGSSGSPDRVKIEAVVSDRGGSCPSLRFRLGGIRVDTSASTQFELPCDQVVNGRAVQAQGARLTGDVLVAREVEADDDARVDPKFEAEGPVEAVSLSSDCATPSGRQIAVQGLRFAAGDFTRFEDIAGGCTGLAVGMRVRAKGPLGNPAVLQATEVVRRDP